MSKKVKIAIIGLGRVGCKFLEKMLLKKTEGIEIVGVAEINECLPGISLAKENFIRVFDNASKITALGDSVDIIFELTGKDEVRKMLREGLMEADNRHTILAPEIVAHLIWELIADGEAIPDVHTDTGY